MLLLDHKTNQNYDLMKPLSWTAEDRDYISLLLLLKIFFFSAKVSDAVSSFNERI